MGVLLVLQDRIVDSGSSWKLCTSSSKSTWYAPNFHVIVLVSSEKVFRTTL